MSSTIIENAQADLTDIASGHEAFVTADEIGADAATEAPATSPLCVGVIVGATLGLGC